ncbi:hypothetical protein MMC26_005654 [Xylographa opegraphella]|nr:hypothetical protein [Xylographa opegraphella]
MPVEKQKLRQTCDPCRKAKVRCNRKSPICSRCLASGAACDYGISNRGGRWKNGEKMGVRVTLNGAEQQQQQQQHQDHQHHQHHHRHQQHLPPAAASSHSIFDAFLPDASAASAMTHFPTGETTAADGASSSCWQQSQHDHDIWAAYDPITISPLTPFRQFSSPSTPTTHSSSSSLSSIWPPPSLSSSSAEHHHRHHHHHLPPAFPSSMAPSSSTDKHQQPQPPLPAQQQQQPMPCSCLVIMLQMLQNLHQSFPQAQSGPSSDLPTLNYAIVLDMNEDATSCCATMLRCPSCKAEDSSIDAFIVLAALLRKVLSLTEAWVTVPDAKDLLLLAPDRDPQGSSSTTNNNSTSSSTSPSNTTTTSTSTTSTTAPHPRQMELEDERRLKREVALIGIKKMEAVLAQLKLAGQRLQPDYERLTCTSLTVSLGARLKLATVALDQDREGPSAA